MKVLKHFTVLFIMINFILYFYINQLILSFDGNDIYDYFTLSSAVLCALFFLIGMITFMRANQEKADVAGFVYLCFSIGWLVQAYVSPEDIPFVKYFYACIYFIFPFVVFTFFVFFTNQKNKKMIITLLAMLITTYIILSVYSQVFHRYKEQILILVVGVCCIFLSIINKHKQQAFSRKYQKLLLMGFLLTFIPYFILQLPMYVSVEGLQVANVFLLILPWTISYILVKRNAVQLHGTLKDYLLELFVTTILIICVVIFAIVTLKMPIRNVLFFLMAIYLVYFLVSFFRQELFNYRYVKAHKSKSFIELEHKDLVKQLSYEQYLKSVGDILAEMVNSTIKNQGMLLIWKENNHLMIFKQTGTLINKTLTKEIRNNLGSESGMIPIGGQIYYLSPLVAQNQIIGWLLLDIRQIETVKENKLEAMNQRVASFLSATKSLNLLQQQSDPYYVQVYRDNVKDMTYMQKTEEIKKEISYYLHDDILQNILGLKNFAMRSADTGKQQTETLQFIAEQLGTLNENVRQKMFDLYPSSLVDLPFSQSVSILINQIEENYGKENLPEILIDIEQDIQTSNQLKLVLYRIMKELINNALKYAEAKHINIKIVNEYNRLILTVTDDGTGFEVDKLISGEIKTGGFGLSSIFQTVNSLGGKVKINAKLGGGSKFVLTIPNERESE